MDEAREVALEAAFEEFRRQIAKDEEEKHQRHTANAIAMGFSSLEEQTQHEWDERLRVEDEYRQRLPEEAAAAGMTVEEYRRHLFSNKDFIPPSPELSFSQCDCEEHPNPWFCPDVLLDFRSQDRPDFWDFEELNRTRIETLRIKPEDKSKRLDSKTLETAWDTMGPTILPLPIWARAKPDILTMPRADSIGSSNNLIQNTPSLASTSLSDQENLGKHLEAP
ncbi:MAG: hypothetical protein Q9187_008236 [Circinaria calcarea]